MRDFCTSVFLFNEFEVGSSEEGDFTYLATLQNKTL